ncbi:MAG: tetratricopeptide repeat protein [Rhodomicrobium sp.]
MFLFRAHHYLDDKRDCDSAIKDLDQASRLEPDHASYYLLRGVAYACKGDHDHAIADYTEAIALNPNWPNFYSNRAASWKAKGDTVREQVDLAAAARAEQRGIFGRIVMLIRYW